MDVLFKIINKISFFACVDNVNGPIIHEKSFKDISRNSGLLLSVNKQYFIIYVHRVCTIDT